VALWAIIKWRGGVLKNTGWDIVTLDTLTYAGNLNRLMDIKIWEKEKH